MPLSVSQKSGEFFESLVLPDPRPYAARAPFAQQRVLKLLERLGNPHHGLRCIHIAGSKGKGSTALYAESILQAAGVRTGTFTSPHLERWTERFRIGAEEVSEGRLACALSIIRPHVDELLAHDPQNPPTFFDTITATALLLFHQSAVELAIIETGIGGRLDATRVVQAVVTCITNIELEHTDKLGSTIAEIAREKAGIIRRDTPLVTGRLGPSAEQEITRQARILEAPIRRLGRELQLHAEPGERCSTQIRLRTDSWRAEATLQTPGLHLAESAALACQCVAELDVVAEHELQSAMERGLSAAALPGRVEVLSSDPLVIVDGAHTDASARALGDALECIGAHRVHFVLSVSPGKSLGSLLDVVATRATRVTLTRADDRSLEAGALAERIKADWGSLELRTISEPVRAITHAHSSLGEGEALCATGSVYMAGVARAVLARRLQSRGQIP